MISMKRKRDRIIYKVVYLWITSEKIFSKKAPEWSESKPLVRSEYLRATPFIRIYSVRIINSNSILIIIKDYSNILTNIIILICYVYTTWIMINTYWKILIKGKYFCLKFCVWSFFRWFQNIKTTLNIFNWTRYRESVTSSY